MPNLRTTPRAPSSLLPPATPRDCAFTLVELLVVIGIITLLISILIPAVSRIRLAAYDASTKNEIAQIASACHRYFDDFRAYPGPISNTDLENSPPSPPAGIQDTFDTGLYLNGTTNPGTITLVGGVPTRVPATNANAVTMQITASENLVLGLLGGLWRNPTGDALQYVNGWNPANGANPGIPGTLIGTGPRGLAPGSATASNQSNKVYSSYLQITSFPGSTLLLNGDGSAEDGLTSYRDYTNRVFRDSIIPVFTDQYPDHLPILYLRARVGAKGILSGYKSYASSGNLVQDPTTNQNAFYNYDIREITPYTWAPGTGILSASPVASTPGTGTVNSGGIIGYPPPYPQHGLQGAGTLYYTTATQSIVQQGQSQTPPWNLPVPTNTLDNAGQYFMNSAIQPSNASSPDYINATGTPRGKDEFILISAGRDRAYGTVDDATSFGDVEP